MKIKRTSQIIVAVVILLSLMAIAFSIVAHHYKSVSQRAYEARRVMFGLSDQLARGSDRLTNSVRAYAATGDKRYYQEFQRELTVDRNRDRAVEGLRQLGLTQAEEFLITRAKQSSDRLVSLENEAFAAVQNGNVPRAIQIVYGPEFVATKETIVTSITECRRALEQRFTALATRLADRSNFLDNLALFALLLNAVTVVGALVLFYRRRVVNPLAHITQSLSDLITRREGATIGYQNETSEIGEVARSIEKYHVTVQEADRQHWVRTSLGEVSDSLQDAEKPQDFGNHLLSTLVPLVGGGYGAFYIFYEEDGLFHFTSGYGFNQEVQRRTFAPGEGIAGQAVVEKKIIRLNELPSNYMQIESTLGSASPRSMAAVPVLAQDRAFAVFEVASFSAITPEQHALLEEVAVMVGLKLDVLQRNLRTRELLEQVRLSEQRLRETENFFRSVLELSPDGMMVVYPDGTIRLVNAESERLFGYTRDELIGKRIEMLVPEEIRDQHKEFRQEFHRSPRSRTMGAGRELNGQRKDGTHFPVEIGLSPLHSPEGEGAQVAVSIRDITDRKRAEAELLKRKDELQRINFLADSALDLTKAGYWHVPLDGSGWYNSSERAARIFGDPPTPDHRYTLEHWTSHVHAGDEAAAKVTMENFNAAVEGTIPAYDATYAYKRPVDGQIVWIHALGRVVKDENEKPTDMYGVTQDITDFKLLEMELMRAKQKADEATLMKSMFLANMSHEIRTPMNAIIGLSYLALKTSLNAKQKDYLTKIHSAGSSLLSIINDILDFSKIEAGKLDIEKTNFKLDDVITSVTTVTGQKMHDKGLEFLAEISKAVPQHLLGDPLRLSQILTNLVNNAIKFTEQGEILLKAEVLTQTADKCELKFSIRDTGLGMTKEQTSKLFQPFTQADMSTTRKHGGTGLGLTICRRLVELMDGQIWVESEPGQGSMFTFTVKLGVGEEKGSRTIVPERLSDLHVLVVDDNASAREIINDALIDIVRQIETAASGAEALEMIKQSDESNPYDIIFMDWRMPRMDGLRASSLIKNDETLRHQPAIVMVTAFGREEVRDEAEQLHLEGFLLKPVTKSTLVDSLITVFSSTEEEMGLRVSESQSNVSFPGLRILLTEDNEINQQIAVELLESVGAKVDIANHGREAVEKLLQDGSYDIVLMDLQMPEMDGYQATTKIRSYARFADLPIIAMTAHATTEERERCLSIGMNDHISKPIHPALLYETIGRFYQRLETQRPEPFNESQPLRSEIPSIEGLDSQDGLSRVGGNQKLYLKLLRQFVDQQSLAPVQISEALGAKDHVLAERVAHTLKGVAGSLGAREVEASSARLEKLIRDNADTNSIDAAFKEFSFVVSDFANRLRSNLPHETVATSAADIIDPRELANVVRDLVHHLNTFDPAASDFFDEHRDALRQLFSAETFTALANQISQFAFADAMVTLKEAAEKKGFPL